MNKIKAFYYIKIALKRKVSYNTLYKLIFWTMRLPEEITGFGGKIESVWREIAYFFKDFLIHTLAWEYRFPLAKILEKWNIQENWNITLTINVRDNTTLKWVIKAIEDFPWENISFEISLREFINPELRQKIEDLRRSGKSIQFLWGLEQEKEFWYTTLEEWIENLLFVTGEIIDTKSWRTMQRFQDLQIRGERILQFPKK